MDRELTLGLIRIIIEEYISSTNEFLNCQINVHALKIILNCLHMKY